MIERHRAVVVEDRDEAALEATLVDGDLRPVLALQRQGVHVDACGPVERRDQVGRQTLRNLRMDRQQVLVVGVEAIGAVARRTTHRLDTGADHEILVAGPHPHGRKRHGLLARPAESVQGHAGNRDGPAGVEDRHAADVVRVITGMRAVAADDVVDIGPFEADPFVQPVEHLAQHLLWVQVRQAPLALLANSSR